MERNEDLSRRDTRAFTGLGPCIFKIDFAKFSPEAYAQPASPESGTVEEVKVVQNEINTEISVKNTDHHK